MADDDDDGCLVRTRKRIAKWFGCGEEGEKSQPKWLGRSMLMHGGKADTPEPANDQQPSTSADDTAPRRKVAFEEIETLERQAGVGLVGKMMDRRYRQSRMDSGIRFNLASIHVYRPYFTYWVTGVQIIVYIVTVSVYGIAPINVAKQEQSEIVLRSNLAYDNVIHFEEPNMWIGPRPLDLLHLGAKYTPCMRWDRNVMDIIAKEREMESGSGCCIYYDKSGCVQTIANTNMLCAKQMAKWDNTVVCGLDPKKCKNPSNLSGAWGTDKSKWPICKEQTTDYKDSEAMTCDALGRPCCVGVTGECVITTDVYCKFLRGYFHPDAFLCSQVSCMASICGMVPFTDPEVPDQFIRFFVSQAMHAGLLQLIITIVFQLTVMRDLEKLLGWIRISLIYVLGGVVGSLASGIFIPYSIEAGPTGSQFAIIACLFVEVAHSWHIIQRPGLQLLKLGSILFVLFLLGFLPMVDNYAHCFGFLFGFVLAFALMPFVTFRGTDRQMKTIIIVSCLALSVVILTVLILVFYLAPIYKCQNCFYFNCIPFTSSFCDTSEMLIHRVCNYSDITCQ